MTREELEKKLLEIREHETLEEHVATELTMQLIDAYAQAKVLEARMVGLLEAESLFTDDPNPDAVRPLSSPQQLKLRKHVATLQAELDKSFSYQINESNKKIRAERSKL